MERASLKLPLGRRFAEPVRLGLKPGRAGGGSILRREDDGTITVLSLARPWTPRLTREDDGTITVN